ncbi:hypothetical protein [Streptomyces sp. YIM S03343]
MPGSSHTTLALPLRGGIRRTSRTARYGGGRLPLAVLAVVFTTAQLLLVGPTTGLGWDETVYVSQISAHAPAANLSAPRARGISLLVAPVTSWSSSTPLLRVYLAVLSGLALYLALRTWRGLFPVRVLTLAGALFASLWVTLFYAPAAMPNYWVAVGALTAAACFLRARADRADRAALWGLGAGAALMALMRPTDAVWTTLPLLVLAVATRLARPLVVLLAGLVAGSAEWVIEAYVRYGGLVQRLSDGSAVQGGLGWHDAVPDQLRSLGGRMLCRPCTGEMPSPVLTLWWFVLPVLAVLGAVTAVRAGRPSATLVPFACGLSAAFPYLFLIGYAAPRFLLPAYALLLLPVADALDRLVSGAGGAWRPVAVTLVAIGLAGHLAVQYAVLAHTVDRARTDRAAWSRLAADLHRRGVSSPCLLTGDRAIPIAFYTGCHSAATGGPDQNTTPAQIQHTAQHLPTATLVPLGAHPPSYARDWTPIAYGGVRIYLAPHPEG